MRYVFAPAAEVERRSVIPALREPQRNSATTKPMQAAELWSVKMGLLQWPASGDPAEVTAAFAESWRKLRPLVAAGTRDGDLENHNQARQLFADWWKLDPAAALRFVSEPPGVFTERGGMFLVPLVAARDPRQAWKLADLAMQRHERSAARVDVMRAWAHRAPQEAMAFTASLSGSQRAEAERAALRGWVALNARDAIAWVAALPESWRKEERLEAVTFEAASSDPASFVAALRRGEVEARTCELLLKYRRESGADPFGALARAAIASDPDPRGFCLWAAEKGLVPLASAAWAALMERDGLHTAEAIARLAASLPDNGREAFSAALGTAAPEAGLAWALTNNAPLAPLAKAWAGTDPEAALAALNASPQSPEMVAALRAAAFEARESAPVAVLQVMASLPARPDDDHAREDMHDMVKRAAFADPVQTLEILGTIPTATPEQVSMLLAVGAHRDPHGTAAALARVELPVTDTVAAESFTRGWASNDPAAASLWVRDLPAGEMRDGGAAGLARSVARTDPPGAFAWAVEVTEPDMRQRVLCTVIESAVKAGTPLEALLSEPRLTPEERGTLRAHAATVSKP